MIEAQDSCPVYLALKVIGKKWTLLIILEFQCGGESLRYNELQRSLEGITPKVLSDRLREMAASGLLRREVHPTAIPIRVEYSLTKKGKELGGVIDYIKKWGKKWTLDKEGTSLPCETCNSSKDKESSI